MNKQIRLSDLRPGEKAVVKQLLSENEIRERLLDIGLIEGTQVECIGCSPGGDPIAYLIRGAVIAIRKKDGKEIFIKKQEEM